VNIPTQAKTGLEWATRQNRAWVGHRPYAEASGGDQWKSIEEQVWRGSSSLQC